MKRALAFLLMALTVTLAACGGGGGAPPPGGGNADRGKTLVVEKQCGTCHVIPGVAGANGVIGPSLAGIGNAAATRKPNTTAEAYLQESIKDPNAFIAPGPPPQQSPSLMVPPVPITDAEIPDIVAFLLTLK